MFPVIQVSYTDAECDALFADADGVTFRDNSMPSTTFACGEVADNFEGSYLTMLSLQGFIFGVINVIGNFGTVFGEHSN